MLRELGLELKYLVIFELTILSIRKKQGVQIFNLQYLACVL